MRNRERDRESRNRPGRRRNTKPGNDKLELAGGTGHHNREGQGQNRRSLSRPGRRRSMGNWDQLGRRRSMGNWDQPGRRRGMGN
ncbi:hypothetical protein EYF80_063971 [Liparis tanakae]|uniref:Uncharacterized protein n=1 Tax=Liparis tanakae TaxID=230148 RepID=A0A4Z2EBH3_9TELE|nr:hypothetical protein EYF80_063971 [Liparis tanakae]